MEKYSVLPDKPVNEAGPVSKKFLKLGIQSFHAACRYVHELPYGYNSNREDVMILFKENKGSCTAKHGVIATLAEELGLPVGKTIGIYALEEDIVTGTDRILSKYSLPYLPMVHCFLESGGQRVDLTEGNANGKNKPIDQFLYTEKVDSMISGKDEYLIYRKVLKEDILERREMKGIDLRRILYAREEALKLLKSKVA
ncbi:MAG: hypothetical protein ACOC5U_00700 [Candidatus Aminicenantaceae bacterium]